MGDVMPSLNGSNGIEGRDHNGRFQKGNRGGPGNPHAKRATQLRSAVLRAVTPDDIAEVIRALVVAAKGGDVMAARELLNRVAGKPATFMELSIEVDRRCPECRMTPEEKTRDRKTAGLRIIERLDAIRAARNPEAAGTHAGIQLPSHRTPGFQS